MSLIDWAQGVRDRLAEKHLRAARRDVREGYESGDLATEPAQLEDEAENVIDEHEEGFDRDLAAIKSLAPEGAIVGGRIKSLPSVLRKLPARADKYDRPEKLEDVTGYSVIVRSVDEVYDTVEALKRRFSIVDEDDSVGTPKDYGYRAFHLTVRGLKDALPKEVQIRTANQDRLARWSHLIYKPQTPEQQSVLNSSGEAVEQFAQAASDYFDALDHGEQAEPPAAPPDVEEAFGVPWSDDVPDAPEDEAEGKPGGGEVEASQVSDNLWVGGLPPPGDVVGEHFDALVLAADEYQPPSEEFPSVDVLHVPLPDFASTDIDTQYAVEARRAAEWVNEQRARGDRVLVTCRSGHHRSALIAAMALRMGPERMTATQAVDVLRKARGWKALSTGGVVDALGLAS